MGNIHQQYNDVRVQPLQGRYGVVADSSDKSLRCFSGWNKAPQAKDVWTITVSAATNSHAYDISVNGVTVSYTSDGSATQAEISAGLTAAIEASPLAFAICTVADGTGSLVLTGRFPGVAFTVSSSDSDLSVAHTTTAASADSIDFGDVVILSSAADEATFVARADEAYLTAQVDTYTFSNTYAAGEVISAWVEIPGYPRATASVIAATDLDTSLAALSTALNTAIDALIGTSGAVTSAYTTSGNVLTLTAQQKGKAFTSSVSATTNTYTKSTNTGILDVTKVIAGIARDRFDARTSPTATVGTAITAYAPNEGVQVVNQGRLWVKAASAPNSLSSAVWLGLSGSERGKLFTSAAASRVLVPDSIARWSRPERSGGSDGIAVVSISTLI